MGHYTIEEVPLPITVLAKPVSDSFKYRSRVALASRSGASAHTISRVQPPGIAPAARTPIARLVVIRRLAPSRGSPEKVMANSFAKRRYARRLVASAALAVVALAVARRKEAPWAVVGPSSRSNEGRIQMHFP